MTVTIDAEARNSKPHTQPPSSSSLSHRSLPRPPKPTPPSQSSLATITSTAPHPNTEMSRAPTSDYQQPCPHSHDNSTSRQLIFSSEDDPNLSTTQHMFAGGLAGITEHIAMYPIDTIKTRMQSYVALRDFANLGMLHATRAIVSSEGLRSLWRGVGAVAVSAGPAHALYFATYEALRRKLAPQSLNDGLAHPVATAVAGACATILLDGVMTPMDVVKQRMQLGATGTYSSVWECSKRVYLNHGIRAFYAGYGATLVMNVPFTAVYFSAYETAKRLILDWRGKGENEFSTTSHCAAGALAGAMAAASTNPLDVAKTRLQTQGEIGARRYRGLVDVLRSIRVEEGFSGLMSGVRPRILFHMPAAAVCWTTYEFCKHLMAKDSVRHDEDAQDTGPT